MVDRKRVARKHPKMLEAKWRCTYQHPDGQRCGNRRWAGKILCYQHDPGTAGLRGKAGEGEKVELTTVHDIQEVVAETLGELRAGRIKPGEAYARGYLAQLALTAVAVAAKESKLDVKHFWDVVDLGAAFEKAGELQKQKEKEQEAKEARAAHEAAEAQEAGEVAFPEERP